jgi:hypothetical protein
MNNTILDEIYRIGLDSVARILHVSPPKLKNKINNPRLFTLHELSTLMEEKIITDKMVLLMLDSLKGEE